MARFGKKAALDEQKSTQGVECLVTLTEGNVSVDRVTGEPVSYYVEIQRLQDGVDEDDARSGKADSNPYITNRREQYVDSSGEVKNKVIHQQKISAYAFEQIREASPNMFVTMKEVFDAATGETKYKKEYNFCVKENIGFERQKGGTAYVYMPKSYNENERDKAYSFRNMPKAGRELTQEILDRHKEITSLAKEYAYDTYVQKHESEDNLSDGPDPE